MQLAFDLYYQGIKSAQEIADGKLRNANIADLREAAETGWGAGVSDLREGYYHFAASGGRWKDGNRKDYWGGVNGVLCKFLGHGHTYTSQAAANFLAAIDEKVKEAASKADEHARNAEQMTALLQNPAWNQVGSKQWEKVGEYLEKIQSGSEWLGRALWLIPPQGELGEAVSNVAEVGDSFIGAAADIRAAVSTFDNAQRAGFGTGSSLLLAALEKGMGKVPVIGAVYAQAIALIPSIAAGFQAIAERQKNQLILARIGPAVGQQMEW
jgi:hypothetical protein